MTTSGQADGKADQPRPPQLGDVIDRMLDKGVVIESHTPVFMLDIGLLGVSSRVSIMAVSRWDLLVGMLGIEQPRRRSKSLGRLRALGQAQESGRRRGKPCLRPAAGREPVGS